MKKLFGLKSILIIFRQKLKKAWTEQMEMRIIKDNYEKIFD
jgi:hypothetical protein